LLSHLLHAAHIATVQLSGVKALLSRRQAPLSPRRLILMLRNQFFLI
jgi:hypothetical protein